MRNASFLAVVLLLAGCGGGATEVLRQRSPDGKIEAVLLERAHGETADYEVRAEPVDPADGQAGVLLSAAGVPRGVVCPHPYVLSWTVEAGVRTVNFTAYSGRFELSRSPPTFRSGQVLARFGGALPAGTSRCPDAPAPKGPQ